MPLAYSIDKDAKTITFSYDDAKLKSVADKSKGAYSENDLETALESLASTYTYSVDRECLTLTESEYGDQMVLDKKGRMTDLSIFSCSKKRVIEGFSDI